MKINKNKIIGRFQHPQHHVSHHKIGDKRIPFIDERYKKKDEYKRMGDTSFLGSVLPFFLFPFGGFLCSFSLLEKNPSLRFSLLPY